MASTYTIPSGLSLQQKKAVAALLACAPCCGTGSGGGSGGSSVSRPCGCSACTCCVGVCWWKTTWHKSWTTSSGKYATGLPSPEWTLTNYSMTLGDVSAEFYWGGETGGSPGSCALGFSSKLNADCTLSSTPAVLSGTAQYTRTIAPFDVKTFNIVFYPTISIQFACNDTYVFCLYTGFTSDGGFTGSAIPGSSGNGFLDYALASDGGTDEIVSSTSGCGFTASSPTDIGLPAITIVPVV